MGQVMATPWMRRPATRRLIFAGAALVLAALSVWPQRYLARADLMPQDASNGLSAMLGGGGGGGLASLGALLGGHQSIEADLTMARSEAVLRSAIARMGILGKPAWRDSRAAEVKIRNKLDISAIRGSILQITARDADPAFAKALVGAYVGAVQDSLTALTLHQSAQRRGVAENRLNEASARLAAAQAALTRFRQPEQARRARARTAAGCGRSANSPSFRRSFRQSRSNSRP